MAYRVWRIQEAKYLSVLGMSGPLWLDFLENGTAGLDKQTKVPVTQVGPGRSGQNIQDKGQWSCRLFDFIGPVPMQLAAPGNVLDML